MATNVRFKIEGIIELQKALQQLPDELVAESRAILENQAEITKYSIYAAYPRRTGNLRDGMTLTYKHTPVSSTAIIRNKAPHAYIYETGTVARQTAIGAVRGSMPAGKVFISRMIAGRRAFWKAIRALLARQGLRVSGEEAA
jgi:hypothetical protein